MRLVGILGTPFCGSTFLCRLLSSVPGLEVGGEVHWIDTLKGPEAQEHLKRRRLECALHPIPKGGCPVFTEAWLNRRFAPEEVYDEVGALLGAEVLLVSDKEPRRYDQLHAGKRLEVILLFKHPLGHCMSNRRHANMPVDLALRGWAEAYTEAIMWAQRNARQTVVVAYERLAESPVAQVAAICESLDLPSAELAEGELPADYHHIAGNTNAHLSTEIALDESWKAELSEDEQQRIRDDQRSQKLHKLLTGLAV